MTKELINSYIESNKKALATHQARGNTELVRKIEARIAELKAWEPSIAERYFTGLR
jgi:hypothetical protein